MTQPKAVFVLGMHRGGTSMVAGLLRHLGVYLGPESLMMGASRANPLGHFEMLPFERANESILAAFGGRWNDPPDLPGDWLESPVARKAMGDVRAVVDAHFKEAPIWGFKDPRACLLIPFWTEAAGRDVEFVVVVRNPLDVALSLKARDRIPVQVGARLWLRHMKDALEGTRRASRALFFYDLFLDAFDPEFSRLVAFVGGGSCPVDEARRFARQEFRHHKSSLKDLEDRPEIDEEVKDAYRELVETASPGAS